MDFYYLLSGKTEGRVVVLRFYDVQKNEMLEFRDAESKPYFFLPHPLSKADEKGVGSLYGEVEIVKKRSLFTDRLQKLTEVAVYTSEAFKRARKTFQKVWEVEVEQIQHYVYDRELAFGAPHKKRKKQFTPVTLIPGKLEKEFEDVFADVRANDPRKYAYIRKWFNLLHQPIPRVKPEHLGLKEVNSERLRYAFMLARIANIPVDVAYESRRVSSWLKSMIYDSLKKRNILIPTSKELRRGFETHRVPGALTLTPREGIYFNTVVCDFESLYPSCIDSYNLSYETVNCQHGECRSNRIEECEEHWVCTKRRGFYSILVGALKDLRVLWFKPRARIKTVSKRERRDAQALAELLKLISVSSYGVTVRIHGLACPPLAECITGYGRWALQNTWNLAKDKGLDPIYGDTDSIFLHNPRPAEVEWLIEAVKSKLRLDLSIEKQYSLCVLPAAKKAYFGITHDGTPDVKGLTVIKSNSPGLIQQVFRDCLRELRSVENHEDYESAKRRMVKVVNVAVKRLKRHEIKLENLVYSVKLYFDPKERQASGTKVTPQPYQCAIQLLDNGKRVDKGDLMHFIKVSPFNYKGKTFTVKPAEFVKDVSEINVQDYIRNMTTALEQTFAPMGIDLSRKSEAKISDWFRE